jgi:3-oxo-5-alpha-steroid 4-dehydrogenase 3 / polyprenol reductase
MTTNLFLLACYVYFIAGICGSLFSFFAQKLIGPSTLFSHGKAATSSSVNKNNFSRANWITKLTVSKSFFWHFYAFGLLFSIAFIIFGVHPSIPAILLAIQCFRRMLECFWLMPGAKRSQMHLIHYMIGLSYYPALLLSFHFQESELNYFWIALFIVASVFQCYCHWILGSSRRNLLKEGMHRPLNHAIFKFVHTPHYLAELLIYTSIAGLFRFSPLSILNLVWITSILGVSAKNSADWLCDAWKYKSHKNFCKYLMIPFLF